MNTSVNTLPRFFCSLLAAFGTMLYLAIAENLHGDETISTDPNARSPADTADPADEASPSAREDRDWTLYLGMDETVEAIRNPNGRLWVDVRSEQAYERVRIPGSLHIPLFAVKTKSFLRNHPVVLVDEGYGSYVLEDEVRKLRDMGFADLSIWYGGLNVWSLLGGTLEGTTGHHLGLLPPVALTDVLHVTDWLVVDAGRGGTSRPSGVETLAFDPAQPEAFVTAINAMIESNPGVSSVLIANDEGHYDPALLGGTAGIWGFVYYLDGGWAAWKSHRRMMEASQHGGSKVATTTAGGTRTGRRGCGGCP